MESGYASGVLREPADAVGQGDGDPAVFGCGDIGIGRARRGGLENGVGFAVSGAYAGALEDSNRAGLGLRLGGERGAGEWAVFAVGFQTLVGLEFADGALGFRAVFAVRAVFRERVAALYEKLLKPGKARDEILRVLREKGIR